MPFSSANVSAISWTTAWRVSSAQITRSASPRGGAVGAAVSPGAVLPPVVVAGALPSAVVPSPVVAAGSVAALVPSPAVAGASPASSSSSSPHAAATSEKAASTDKAVARNVRVRMIPL